MNFVQARAAHRTYSNCLHKAEAKYAATTFGMLVTEGATAVSAMVAEQGQIERFATGCARGLLFEWRSREELFQRILSGFVSPVGDLGLERLMQVSALAAKQWT